MNNLSSSVHKLHFSLLLIYRYNYTELKLFDNLMSQVLSQIESYDNLIPFMVDALKTCTGLSNDVMSYCIINQVIKVFIILTLSIL